MGAHNYTGFGILMYFDSTSENCQHRIVETRKNQVNNSILIISALDGRTRFFISFIRNLYIVYIISFWHSKWLSTISNNNGYDGFAIIKTYKCAPPLSLSDSF